MKAVLAHAGLMLFAIGFAAHQTAQVSDKPDASVVPQYATFPPSHGRYWVVPLRIIDGDSVEFGVLIKVQGRLWGCNAPENNTADGLKAHAQLAAILPVGKITEATLHDHEKFGRVLVDFRGRDDWWVVKSMIDTGHAKPWDGKGERP